MTNQWAIHDERKHGAALCWICNRNEANSGEHKTKRSDLAAVLRAPTQGQPLYFHDLEQRNKPIRSFDAKILKAPVRICHECNTSRTQPHDRAWERMSDELRRRDLAIGRWVRANGIFRYDTRLQMINVHLFFLKLFGCMLCEAKANGYDVPIDIALFSQAIASSSRGAPIVRKMRWHRGPVEPRMLRVGSGRRACLLDISAGQTSPLACCSRRPGSGKHRPDLWPTVSDKLQTLADGSFYAFAPC